MGIFASVYSMQPFFCMGDFTPKEYPQNDRGSNLTVFTVNSVDCRHENTQLLLIGSCKLYVTMCQFSHCFSLVQKSSPLNFTQYAVLPPQHRDRNVTTDNVTSLHHIRHKTGNMKRLATQDVGLHYVLANTAASYCSETVYSAKIDHA